jgi:hypothetical protein
MKSFSLLFILSAGTAAWLACGPSKSSPPSVSLDVTPVPNNNRFDAKANVTGSAEGVRYRFYANDGACDPQESDSGTAQCTAGPMAKTIAITVEIFRGTELLDRARKELPVPQRAVEPDAPQPPQRPVQQGLDIRVTTIPPYDPTGGPDTRADIAGIVYGAQDPSLYKVVVYAHTDLWYVQPLLGSTTDLDRTGSWSNWTHTGAQYAALLVRSSYSPPAQLGQRPQAHGDVVAVTVVDGRR